MRAQRDREREEVVVIFPFLEKALSLPELKYFPQKHAYTEKVCTNMHVSNNMLADFARMHTSSLGKYLEISRIQHELDGVGV